eukprot:229831_1
MGAEPSGMCKNEYLIHSKNNSIAWSLYFSFVVTLVIILIYVRKKILSLPLLTFSACKNTLFQSNTISAGLTALTQTLIIDKNYQKKCGDQEAFIMGGDVKYWIYVCIFTLIMLIIVTIYKLKMEQLNKIPYNIFLPHTQKNCVLCDNIDQYVSSKFGFIHKSFTTWNCPKVLLSVSFTYLMFGLGASFAPYYQIQYEPNIGICKCWDEDLESISSNYAFILLLGVFPISLLFSCNILWCCALWNCPNTCNIGRLCCISCYRFMAFSIILTLPIIGMVNKIDQWIRYPVIPFTVTNFYVFLCFSLFVVWLMVGFVYYKKRKYQNEKAFLLKNQLELHLTIYTKNNCDKS